MGKYTAIDFNDWSDLKLTVKGENMARELIEASD